MPLSLMAAQITIQPNIRDAHIHTQTKATIKAFYEQSHYLMDPHTAVGVHSALEYAQQHQAAEEPEATICLATAHAAKFGDAIQDSISTAIELPAGSCSRSLSNAPGWCHDR